MDFPPDFLRHLEGVPGFDREQFMAAHETQVPVTSIRLNPAKLADTSLFSPVDEQLVSLEGNAHPKRIPWTSYGYYLSLRPFFTFDPAFHAGTYYVQEASSMFLEHVIRSLKINERSFRLLDLCAAPGGKSTLLQSIISPSGMLVSNETIRTRVPVLAENTMKWGGENVVITNNDPADFAHLPHFFDMMLVDAPCSGSGLFRKDPDAVAEWSLSNVSLCHQRQKRILADVWPALKPGGWLVYATCSFSRQENEDIADWILANFDADSVSVPVDENWGILETRSALKGAAGYRCWPDRTRGEGFYIACFRKIDDAETVRSGMKKRSRQAFSSVGSSTFLPWLKQLDDLSFFTDRDQIRFIPGPLEDPLRELLSSPLTIIQSGIAMGKKIRDELIPHPSLALSNRVSSDVVSIPLNLVQSLHYLRCEEIHLDPALQRSGWALATYRGWGLGWMKVLKQRINNYYPNEWRIRRDPFK